MNRATIREAPTPRVRAMAKEARPRWLVKTRDPKPAMVVELKWNQSVETAIRQIKEKQYCQSLEAYRGRILLVGISYDKDSRSHECRIEEWDNKC